MLQHYPVHVRTFHMAPREQQFGEPRLHDYTLSCASTANCLIVFLTEYSRPPVQILASISTSDTTAPTSNDRSIPTPGNNQLRIR